MIALAALRQSILVRTEFPARLFLTKDGPAGALKRATDLIDARTKFFVDEQNHVHGREKTVSSICLTNKPAREHDAGRPRRIPTG
jgi:hypothetical protein